VRRAAAAGAAILALASSSPALAADGGGGGALGELLAVTLALGVVCLLAFICLLGLKRLQGAAAAAPGSPSELRFVRALPVGARERLVVVRGRGRTLLLGVTAGSIAVLDAEDGGEEASAAADAGLAPADLTRTLLARVFSRRPGER
jgi:flagellar protein FliO/FliZ